jgi:hypothetical protein
LCYAFYTERITRRRDDADHFPKGLGCHPGDSLTEALLPEHADERYAAKEKGQENA